MEEELSVLLTTNTGGEDGILDGGSKAWRPSATKHYFSALDYSLFGAMLAISALIGIYFAFFAKKKQNTTAEYLMGGRNMSLAPVAMSLTASYVSGITLLGVPGEVYTYGMQFSALCFATVIAGLFSAIFFIPVFYELQLNTSYEYLGLRFDRKVQILGSFLFVLTYLLYIPVVIYVPALAINQVSGVNIHLITPIVCLVCIFYTTLGGMKAVVWTDALQILLMFGSLFAIIGVGTNAIGGFETVWQRNVDTNRTELFNLDFDPTTRHTFWGIVIGLSFNLTYHFSVNQGMVQRCLVMRNIKQARILIAISLVGVSILTGISTYTGLQIFAAYYDCDRLSTKVVAESDQLLPYFVMEIADSLPGLPGLFMAGVFSAALSSMSTGLNSMSGVIYEDFISPFMSPSTSEERASFIMKTICAILGIICVGMVFIVENLEGVIQTAWSLEGIACGPKLAVFILGMFYPWASSTGAFAGGITGLIIMGVICIGNQSAISRGLISSPKKPISVDGCTFPFNVTSGPSFQEGNSSMNYLFEAIEASAIGTYLEETEAYDVPWLFRISYTWYALIGLTVSVVAGMIATAITGAKDLKDVHINHLTPPMRPLFSSYCKGEDSEHTINLSGLSSTYTPSQKSAT